MHLFWRGWQRLHLAACLLLPLGSAWAQKPPQTESIDKEFLVQGFKVTGNTLLAQKTIDSLLQRHTGKNTLATLRGALAELQEAYRIIGYGTVNVTLPPQTLVGGRVEVEVSEGVLNDILVHGNKYSEAQTTKQSLPTLRKGKVPNLLDIDTNTVLFNENPAQTVKVVFQPGPKNGTVDALVRIDDQPKSRWNANLNNTGRPNTGLYRAAINFQNANLTGHDDVLGLRAQASPSRLQDTLSFGAMYKRPIYSQLSALEFSANYSDSKNISSSTAAGDLTMSGKGMSVGTKYHWYLPRVGEGKRQVSLGWDFQKFLNDCSLGEFGSAGCGTAAASVQTQPLSIAYSIQSLGEYSGNISFSKNAFATGADGSASAFESVRPGANPSYSILRGSYTATVLQPDGSSVTWRMAAQATPDGLVPGEQFGLGGASTVRGYQEREVVGDQGFNASLEWNFRSKTVDEWLRTNVQSSRTINATFAVFADYGQVSNQLGTVCQNNSIACSLGSVGVGVVLSSSNKWSLRMDVARALLNSVSTQKDQSALHFSLHYEI
jgi:hemolysin activation/secretion protein